MNGITAKYINREETKKSSAKPLRPPFLYGKMEFDYVVIIVGKDLQFNADTKKYFTAWDNYKDSKVKQGLLRNPEVLNKLVRQIYRILLTRGMMGCYVYFMDKETERAFRERLGE